MDDKKKKNTNDLRVVTNGRSAPEDVRSPALCDEDGPHLMASTSSPSLLDGCGDPTTPAGARVERHWHSHHIPTSSCVTSPEVGNAPVQVEEWPASPSPLVSPAPPSHYVPESVFLTPAPPRRRHPHAERPSSAPPHHLEKISGVLLRLVGDHYLCLTCGRQLRTIGDQLALETDLRRALSSSHLYNPNLDQSDQGPD